MALNACSVFGCDKTPASGMRLCAMHYGRMRRNGSYDLSHKPAKSDLPLTAERLKALLSYDPSTGLFTWLHKRGGHAKKGGLAGVLDRSTGYRRIGVDLLLYSAHRLAWLYVTGHWPIHQIDHINGDRTDNRIENLRDVEVRLNAQNRHDRNSANKYGYIGVSAVKRKHGPDKFRAAIRVLGEYKYIGVFETAIAARDAYRDAKKKFHPGST